MTDPADSRPLAGLAIATVFGVGYAPIAPGTFGSAAGLIVWWLLPSSPVVQAIAIVAIFRTSSGKQPARAHSRRSPSPIHHNASCFEGFRG